MPFSKEKLIFFKDNKLCCKCGSPNNGTSLCQICADKNTKRLKKRYNDLKLAKRCVVCGNSNRTPHGKCQKCKDGQQRARKLLRQSVLNHYGNKCSCCDISTSIFLTIDHINNDGAQHKRHISNHLYRWLVKNNFPPEFQTLCYNCNSGKYLNNGTCPHKDRK